MLPPHRSANVLPLIAVAVFCLAARGAESTALWPPTEEERERAKAAAMIVEKPGVRGSALPGEDARVNQDPTMRPQNEPSIAANPNDALHLIAAWNDYYAAVWGQTGLVGYAWTRDGGRTWQSDRAIFDLCPPIDLNGDPSVAFDDLGNAYLGFASRCGMYVAKSTDGGETYGTPVQVDFCCDKPYLTTDANINVLYFVHQRTVGAGPGGSGVFFSKSTNQGATWTTPLQINDVQSSGNGALAQGGANGEIYATWVRLTPGDRLFFDRSLDGGATWLTTDVVIDDAVPPRSPLNGGFRNPNIPSMAVDHSGGPHRGRVYVVMGDQTLGDPDIVLYHSDDDGANWTGPIRVNDDAPGNDADQWFPWVAVDGLGRVHVTFLDRRDDFDGYLFAAYLATSTDGGQTFGPNIRISSGLYGPSDFGFLGDYTGSAVAGTTLHPIWPDGRDVDEDIFSRGIDLTDYDGDGRLNDGNGDGQYANSRCTGGQSVNCDDNCPGVPNASQADLDGDQVGDGCDNCLAAANTGQADSDRDGHGDACDACPGIFGAAAGDPDGDGISSCVDNCPALANATQTDADLDGRGDACDPCPASVLDDGDADGLCGDLDSCPSAHNPLQEDADGDGVGDICDKCPGASDPSQSDTDGDGAGNACDCQPLDPNDRRPRIPARLRTFRSGPTVHFAWPRQGTTDVYSVTRGSLSALTTGSYGSCFLNGVDDTGFDDADLPPAGDGFVYLVQGQNFDCGLGPLGFDSFEDERMNPGGACPGQSFTDHHATSESTTIGMRQGSYQDTSSPNDVYEALTEANNGAAIQLDHTWMLGGVPAGSKVEFHVEGFRTMNANGDNFSFSYSNGAPYLNLPLESLSTSDDQRDRVIALSASVSGTVLVRITDTLTVETTTPFKDTARIDALWIRVVP